MIRYPLYLDLSDRKVLVVGGGKVAARKMKGLIAGGARVTLVSSSLVPELMEQARSGLFRWVRRRYVPGDESGFWLVLALTDNPLVNQRISARARVFVNQATPSSGNPAALPYVEAKSCLLLSVGSEPPDPLLVREVGEFLGHRLEESGLSGYAEEHAQLRSVLLEAGWPRPDIRGVLEAYPLNWALDHPSREERLGFYRERLGDDIIRRLADRLDAGSQIG